MEVRLLGSGGWMPTDRRETACVYVRNGAEVLLLDAGSGLRRLPMADGLLDGVDRVSILLTHFHLDHVIGLSYVPALRCEVELWAPGPTVAGAPSSEVLRRLLDPPLFAPGTLEREFAAVHDIEPGATRVGAFDVETRLQRLHTTPTLAVRLDGVAYCTDTAYDRENGAFARGVRLLLHEAWYAADQTDDPTHSAAGEAARVADAAAADRLVLVHVNPAERAEDELAAAARARFRASDVGADALELSV